MDKPGLCPGQGFQIAPFWPVSGEFVFMDASNIPKAEKPVSSGRGVLKAPFMAGEWEAMTASQRIERCTVKAHEAMTFSRTVSSEAAEAYLLLAEQWLRLADEIGAQQRQQAKDH